MTLPTVMPKTKAEILKELKRLEEWWKTDASYRAPEDPNLYYAQGNMDAYGTAIKLVEELNDNR